MRTAILNLLREKKGQFVSGEDISRLLAVSRTAVWKHVQNLRNEGYVIEANPCQGYHLVKAPDLLSSHELMHGLCTRQMGRRIHYFPSIDSTNQEAKKLAANGAPEGTIVIAETQTCGRGRLSRSWFSPAKGGIWFSLILRPSLYPADAAKFTFLGAVATAKAIRISCGLKAEIKWPNDIQFQGRKLAGILTELSAEIDSINYIVMGIGINVNVDLAAFPAELQVVASSIKQETGRDVSRQQLLQGILEQFEELYELVMRQGFAPVFDMWRDLNCTLGFEVNVSSANQQFTGIAVDIDRQGALLVKREDGIVEKVVAGDISVRSCG